MKRLNLAKFAIIVVWLSVSIVINNAQPSTGGRPEGGPGGRGGPNGQQLPPEQQALVDQITKELSAENLAVTIANSNLVAASFSVPVNAAKISEANSALTKARTAWAMKASAAFAKIQTSETKLSKESINRLIAISSGRDGRGGPGRGPGGPPRGRGPDGQ